MITLLGIPFEKPGPRPGCSLAPKKIREAFLLLEKYSPLFKTNVEYKDIGDIHVTDLKEVEHAVSGIKNPFILGGDHSVTIFSVKALKPKEVVFIDAHLDRRDEYLSDIYSNACVSKRLDADVVYLGARSGAEEEWGVEVFENVQNWPLEFEEVYITLDIDVFDPAFAPGVSYPEPGGITPKEFFEWLKNVKFERIVGIDIVEYNPLFDPSGITAFLAAKIMRELMAKWLTLL